MNKSTKLQSITIGNKTYNFYSIKKVGEELGLKVQNLPYSLKILLENLLRHEDEETVKAEDIKTLANCVNKYNTDWEISFMPSRVLMQDFTGVPAIVDLASMRNYVQNQNGDPKKINPQVAVDLVIDHSVQVDAYGNNEAFDKNVILEIQRNKERYEFLKWGQQAFENFRVVPPGTGICHQVNLEYLAKVVWKNGDVIHPDTVVGTDSHTTMINALSVLGWGVGGIEAEAVMLGQPISMLIPEVIGFKLTGNLKEGVTATDMVLTITNILRKQGVVNKFVEFYGDGLNNLSISDRATISNMSPEYGATCGFFPIDQKTLEYLKLTGRDQNLIDIVESYAKEQFLWRNDEDEIAYFSKLALDLSTIEPVVAGPKRPQDKISLSQVTKTLNDLLIENAKTININEPNNTPVNLDVADDEDLLSEKSSCINHEKNNSTDDTEKYKIKNGDVVIAAITSCTNTSNPNVMIAAGLVARNAVRLGLKPKPWVKTSLAPGSKVVTEYFNKSGLQQDLDGIGFNLVGYGCTTCIGNSGPLESNIEKCIKDNNLVVAAVLSGNRNFEGRINPFVKANYLASPPLVVIYALAGTVNIDLTKDPIAQDKNGKDIYMKDLWPSNQEINNLVKSCVSQEMFIEKYQDVFRGDKYWEGIESTKGLIYNWNEKSTYIQNPPYFDHLKLDQEQNKNINISNANILAILGDSITTDHISPAGNIAANSPAAKFLMSNGINQQDFNSYGSRRGNHNVMMRGTFANIRIKNEMVNVEGGITKHIPTDNEMAIFDAAMLYKQQNTPLVIVAGKEYGSGSSRDWAAKGTLLLNVKAVIAESFERIHRSNLVGMGVLPLTFQNEQTRKSLNLTGNETISLSGTIDLDQQISCTITRDNSSTETIMLKCQLNTIQEIKYFLAGGLLNFVLLKLIKKS